MYFAFTRAQELGFTNSIRKPVWKECPLCNQAFIESSLPHPLVKRLGINQLDFCSPCLRDTVLGNSGNQSATKEEILQYVRDLIALMQRIPPQGYGEGIDDFKYVLKEMINNIPPKHNSGFFKLRNRINR